MVSHAEFIVAIAGLKTAQHIQSAEAVLSVVPISGLSDDLYALSIEQMISIAVIETSPPSGDLTFSAAMFSISDIIESNERFDKEALSALSAPMLIICCFASSERLL